MPLGLKIIWHVLNQGAIKCLILDCCQQCLSPHKDWFFKCLLCLLSKGHNILFIRYFLRFLISIYKLFLLVQRVAVGIFLLAHRVKFQNLSYWTLVNNVRLILQMPQSFFSKGHNILFIQYFSRFIISIVSFACSSGCRWKPFTSPSGEMEKMSYTGQQCLSPHNWFFKRLLACFLRGTTFCSFDTF